MLQVNSVEKQPTGPSYWKFNSSLLEDPEYINLIKDNVPSWLVEFSEVLDKGLLCDLIKYKIRQVTIKYSKTKARERRSRLCEIEKKIKNAKRFLTLFRQKVMLYSWKRSNLSKTHCTIFSPKAMLFAIEPIGMNTARK